MASCRASRQSLTFTKLIAECGIKLKLEEEAVATATVFYHKFCSVMGKEDYEQERSSRSRPCNPQYQGPWLCRALVIEDELVVMAAINLASKVQEVPMKLSDVINTCHRCLKKDSKVLEVDDFYWKLKDSVARYELLLLRALKFDLSIQLPHKYLLHLLLALSRWVDETAWKKSCVTTIAWALLQDSFHTQVCLHSSPSSVATAVILLAVKCCKLTVPCSKATRNWWEPFTPESIERLQEICCEIMDLYDCDLALS